ncbi:formylglycine-generating enzyme required for sulfatase activity [Lacinutrix venerupis]|uniref:formylglycine-generating enzyme family protein n=1 Tax=Lacinutrix venerupis TaxID=1486034 RepID=UPI000EAE1F6A|nr:formylglycine-generating enzyme family protein [Lacinutrix venerupis]RLJ65585.1 formylglycine-generating enzyme required for sulfatase activity [Lacinutrix venerupis]
MKSINFLTYILPTLIILVLTSCREEKKQDKILQSPFEMAIKQKALIIDKPENINTPEGMVWVKGKTFTQGAKAGDKFAMMREKPAHQVSVDGFFIDITEVTNKQFTAFVNATKYITVAERPIDWEVMKVELPEDTPKPHDSILKPGSLVFNKNVNTVANMENYGQWWTWKIGTNWKHPEGPNSSIEGKDDYPVVHIALEDAQAYCKWANKRLPTEAEWESAAQGNNKNAIYTWGNDSSIVNKNANTWQGQFPIKNENKDGFKSIAPVKSYPVNSIGIHDMLGNVWEWTSDLYNSNYYNKLKTLKSNINPQGADSYYNSQNPYQVEMIIKGGSYLCHESYCASFRISARMSTSKDSGSDNLGFRTVKSLSLLKKE